MLCSGQEKIDSEMAKYALQEAVGFRCAGMRLETLDGVTIKHPKEWGRAIRQDNVRLLWDTFFTASRYGVAEQCVAQLLHMRDVIQSTFLWELYASSILFIYDAAQESRVRVVLVDFSYAYRTKELGCHNLVYGLNKLIDSIQSWLGKN